MRRSLLLAPIVALAACLPHDESTPRGAIYAELGAGARVHDYLSIVVTIERVVVLAGSAVPDCHLTYFVDRPQAPVAVVDLDQPFVIEHRALDERSCRINGGFIKVEDTPQRGPGVTDEDWALLWDGSEAGAARVVARVDVRSAGAPRPPVRFDLVYRDLRGSVLGVTEVPAGGKTDIAYEWDSSDLAQQIVSTLLTGSFDRDRDGVVRVDELSPRAREVARVAIANGWNQIR